MIVTSGDWHGEFETMMAVIKEKGIEDCSLIQAGDFGLGFNRKNKEIKRLKFFNKFLNNKKIQLYAIRGNHDDPSYFRGIDDLLEFSNIKLVPDYSIIKIEERNILFIGGAISIDRKYNPDIKDWYGNPWKGRKEGVDYWSKEGLVFNEELLRSIKGIDTVITHTAPAFVYPHTKIGAENWFKHDETLEEELHQERSVLSDAYFILKQNNTILDWHYAHFHDSQSEEYENTKFRLLDIYELFELR